MAKKNINSHNGFKYGIIGLLLIVTMIIMSKTLNNLNSNSSSIIIGLLTIGAGIISIIGLIKSLRGIKEPNTFKKIIGIIINLGIVMLFIYVIAANVSDLYNTFG